MGPVRGLRNARRWRWYGLVFVVVFAVVFALFGVLRDRQLLFLRTDSAAPTPSAGPVSKLGDATTTTTFLTLRSRAFGRGDCVTYDQTPGRESQTMKVVSCALPHLLEVSGGLDLTGRFDHYPTHAEWGAVLDHDCRPSVEALLGGAIDPTGRFIPSAVFATTEAWARGDHTAWCGVIQAPQSRPPSGGHREPFTGKAAGVPQARLSPVGSCWRNDDAFAVPCNQPHDYEVSGRVDLSRRAGPPPAVADDAAWNKIVGADCRRLARHYLVGKPLAKQRFGWTPITEASWAAGRCIVECTVVP